MVKFYELRYSTHYDVQCIKRMLDANKDLFGFLPRAAATQSIARAELIVAMTVEREIVGFCRFHKRRDKQTTIYELYVEADHRRCGIARRFVECLKPPILAKCPVGLEANRFYNALGFELTRMESGKRRKLNVWIKGVV